MSSFGHANGVAEADGILRELDAPTLWSALPNARTSDPDTSKAAALPRRGSQLVRLLATYAWTPRTDEQAGEAAGINQAWKRCSDLRRLGFIADTGAREQGSQGKAQMVCALTDAGRAAIEELTR